LNKNSKINQKIYQKKILKTYKIPYQKINFLCQDFKIKLDR